MTLNDYLTKYDLSCRAFGKLSGVSYVTISRCRNLDHFPTRDVRDKIKAATGGKVGKRAWDAAL